MDRDGQCAIGRGIDVLGELTDIDGVECAIAIGRGHIPAVRGNRRKRANRQRKRSNKFIHI